MRWKVFFFERDDSNSSYEQFSNFGFNSEKTPPQNYALTPFENDLYDMIHSITFTKRRTNLQKQLARDTKDIRSSTDIFVPADKTTNVYKISPNSYNKLLNDNITANYKKVAPSTKKQIDLDAKLIAKTMKLDDRIECLAEREAFITLKDHKDNFEKISPNLDS